jgi:hypothetical protein
MIAYHHFVNHTPDRAGRVYSLWLQQDLFGQWTLVRVRGGRQREPVLHSQVVGSREAGETGGAVGEGAVAARVCGNIRYKRSNQVLRPGG